MAGLGGIFLVVMGGKCPVEELVQGLAVPHAIHVGFPKSERNIAGDALVGGFIVALQIPGAPAVDADIRSAKEIFEPFWQLGHVSTNVFDDETGLSRCVPVQTHR